MVSSSVLCGPVSSSVFVDSCRNCTFVVACQQVTTLTVLLHVTFAWRSSDSSAQSSRYGGVSVLSPRHQQGHHRRLQGAKVGPIQPHLSRAAVPVSGAHEFTLCFSDSFTAERVQESSLNESVNNWDQVDDFKWLAASTPSPNWTILPPEQRKTSWDLPENTSSE